MTTSWEQYFVYFFAAALFSLVPLILWVLSRFTLRGRHRSAQEPNEELHSSRKWEKVQFNSGFYVGVGILSLTLLLLLVLIPIISGLSRLEDPFSGLMLLIFIGSIGGISLFYALRRGDLDWDR